MHQIQVTVLSVLASQVMAHKVVVVVLVGAYVESLQAHVPRFQTPSSEPFPQVEPANAQAEDLTEEKPVVDPLLFAMSRREACEYF